MSARWPARQSAERPRWWPAPALEVGRPAVWDGCRRRRPYALVRSGELRAIQIGNRNQWRVERAKLEEYIEQAYRRAVDNLGNLPAEPPEEA
ncbi:excisionase family DNA-binding protein [Nakamurella endophytica]|uniref:excisionase family DNA-binding protein n=1 Tax=Nakamurella endophytica TaxID=1748367 RepID=UPI001E43B7B9|nr:excisionase family DNA-binding protein [Nakamurella endophytica]